MTHVNTKFSLKSLKTTFIKGKPLPKPACLLL